MYDLGMPHVYRPVVSPKTPHGEPRPLFGMAPGNKAMLDKRPNRSAQKLMERRRKDREDRQHQMRVERRRP